MKNNCIHEQYNMPIEIINSTHPERLLKQTIIIDEQLEVHHKINKCKQ